VAHFQLDAPTCPNCGHVAVRNGACYKCLNCGESLGCRQNKNVKDDKEENNSGQTINKIGLGVSVGMIVGWCLSASMNFFSGFFANSPAIQLYVPCFAACLGLIYITGQLVVRHPNLPWLYMVCCIICLIVFAVTVNAVDKKLAKMGPANADLKLYLQIGDDDDTKVLLTNSLTAATSSSDFGFSRLNSCLVVPIRSNQLSVDLEFEVVNLSSNTDEQAELWVGIPEDWSWSTTNAWIPAREKIVLMQQVFGIPTTNKMKFLGYDVPRPLHSRTGQITDAIRVQIKTGRWLFMGLREQYKDALGTEMSIELDFQEVPNPSGIKPFFAPTKNNPDGTRSFVP
jgi:ribosomal protein L32